MRSIDELKFTDDIMFGAVCISNSDIAKKIAERATGRKIRDIISIKNEWVLGINPIAKKVRMDVHFEDDEAVYSLEMLMYTDKALPRRLRYYASANDLDLLRSGKSFREMKNLYVICICGYDPFGMNRRKYTFRRICTEDPSVELNDGCDIIVLNINGEAEGNSPELNVFLDYLKTGSTGSDELNGLIDTVSERVRHNREWRDQLMGDVYTKYGMLVGLTRTRWNEIRKMIKLLSDAGMEKDTVRDRIFSVHPDLSAEEYDIICTLDRDLEENDMDEAIVEKYLRESGKAGF